MTAPALRARDRRMRRMLHRLDVDVLELAYARVGSEYYEARRVCLACPSINACTDWLAGGGEERPSFCPNLSRFERFIAH